MSDMISVLGGTGALGRGLAARLARAGHPVVLGSRDAGRARTAAAEVAELVGVGGSVDGAANEEASAAAEIVLLATPWDASGESDRGPGRRAGRSARRVLHQPARLRRAGALRDPGRRGSAAEQVAGLLPASTVAAAFHHLSAPSLVRLDRDLSGEDVLVCSDDAAARARVAELARAVTGRRGVEVGALRQARQLEPFTAVLIAVNKRYKTRAGVLLSHVDVDKVGA